MSNLIFNGFNWNSQLIEKFTLQSFFQPQTGETQEMQLPILDYQGNGFKIVTQKTQGQSPNLVFRSIINNVETALLTYNTTTNNFIFNAPINLSNNQINLLANPSLSTDAANKGYVDSAISASAIVSGGLNAIISFSASGSWTTPAGITKAKVTVIGGGGSGGGCVAGSSGSGGGGGGMAIKVYTNLVPLTTYNFTIGAGGAALGTNSTGNGNAGNTTIFTGPSGVMVSAAGGSGGSVSTVNNGGAGGAFGAGISGNVLLAGSGGGGGSSQDFIVSGVGGSSPFGGGASSALSTFPITVVAGIGGTNGGGGSGGVEGGASGSGGSGMIIIEY